MFIDIVDCVLWAWARGTFCIQIFPEAVVSLLSLPTFCDELGITLPLHESAEGKVQLGLPLQVLLTPNTQTPV